METLLTNWYIMFFLAIYSIIVVYLIFGIRREFLELLDECALVIELWWVKNRMWLIECLPSLIIIIISFNQTQTLINPLCDVYLMDECSRTQENTDRTLTLYFDLESYIMEKQKARIKRDYIKSITSHGNDLYAIYRVKQRVALSLLNQANFFRIELQSIENSLKGEPLTIEAAKNITNLERKLISICQKLSVLFNQPLMEIMKRYFVYWDTSKFYFVELDNESRIKKCLNVARELNETSVLHFLSSKINNNTILPFIAMLKQKLAYDLEDLQIKVTPENYRIISTCFPWAIQQDHRDAFKKGDLTEREIHEFFDKTQSKFTLNFHKNYDKILYFLYWNYDFVPFMEKEYLANALYFGGSINRKLYNELIGNLTGINEKKIHKIICIYLDFLSKYKIRPSFVDEKDDIPQLTKYLLGYKLDFFASIKFYQIQRLQKVQWDSPITFFREFYKSELNNDINVINVYRQLLEHTWLILQPADQVLSYCKMWEKIFQLMVFSDKRIK